jgi:hypothetical protein
MKTFKNKMPSGSEIVTQKLVLRIALKVVKNFISTLYAIYRYFICDLYLFYRCFIGELYVRHISHSIVSLSSHRTNDRKAYYRILKFEELWIEWKKILRFTGLSPPIRKEKPDDTTGFVNKQNFI